MVVERELELIWNRERKLTPWMLWELKLMLQMLLELEEEVVEEFHSMVLDSLEPDCLGLDSLNCLELGSLELDSRDCEALEALEDLLLESVAGDDPQGREALGVLSQLLSYCVRRLDTIVQVGTGRALLGR